MKLANGDTRVAGRTSIPSGSTSVRNGYLFEVDAPGTGIVNFSKSYSQGSGNFEIFSIDASSITPLMAAGGNTIPANQNHSDAFFMNTGTSGSIQHVRLWNGPGNERIERVKILSDGSFAIVGKITSPSGVSKAFVTRIGVPTAYNLLFHRVIGDDFTPGSIDEAVAVEQLADGRLLVLGTTLQYARTAQGVIFLAILGLDGVIQEYHTYQVDATVFQPVAKDMAIMSDGTIVVVGTTLNAQGAGTLNGFVMKVTPNLSSATFEEANQPGLTHFGEEFLTVTRSAAVLNYFVGGRAERSVSNVLSYDGLLMRFNINGGVEIAKTIGFSGQDDEVFNDIIEREFGLLEAVGGTENSFRPITNLSNENVFDVRFDGGISNCEMEPIALQFTSKGVTHIEPNVESSTTMVTAVGTLVPTAMTTFDHSSCIVNKTSPEGMGEVAALVESTAIYPNPATGQTMLRIAQLEGTAEVRITDLQGRVLRQFSTALRETSIDLHDWSPGLYLVQVSTRTQQTMQRLVVQ